MKRMFVNMLAGKIMVLKFGTCWNARCGERHFVSALGAEIAVDIALSLPVWVSLSHYNA